MFESVIYDAWKGSEISSTNVTSNSFVICANHSYYSNSTRACEPCVHDNLDDNCQVCIGVVDGVSQCGACDNSQGFI
jgi:hypothetical protein